MVVVTKRSSNYGLATVGAFVMLLINTIVSFVLVLPVIIIGVTILLITSAKSGLTK